MANREKVIKGLECIDMPSDDCLIENCPYEKFGPALCLQQMVKDAIALLKEQEPRVMTKEEIIGWDGYIWYEYNGTKAMKTALINYGMEREPFEEDYPTKELSWETYRETWRAWTARPTDEQRKAVKWE